MFIMNNEEIDVYWAENAFGEKFVTLKNYTNNEVLLINVFKSEARATKECKKIKNILKFLGFTEKV